jgi:uncharacterized protein YhdP
VRRVIVAGAVAAMVVIAVVAASAYWLFSRDGFRRALEAQATSWIGVPVSIGAARATFLPRIAVQLSDIRVGDPARLALDTVELAADLRPLLGGRIENADVLVSDSRIDMPLPFSLPEPANAGDSTVPAAPVRIVSIRSIALRDVRLRSRDREIVVSADSTLDDTTLAIRRFDAESGRSTLAVEGVVALSPRVDAQLHAAANRLDLDELVALVGAFTPESTGRDRRDAPGPGARIVAGISAGEATAGAVRMQQFKTELTLDGSP